MTGSTPRELATRIRHSRLRLLEAADEAPPEAVAVRPGAQSWSVLEVVAHLAPVDADYGGQALEVIHWERRAFRYFDDEAWKVSNADVLAWSWDWVRAAALASAERWSRVVTEMPGSSLEVACAHPRGIAYTAGDIFARLPTHDDMHRQQIEAILAALQGKR